MTAFITVDFACIVGQEKVHQHLLIARDLTAPAGPHYLGHQMYSS